MQLRRDGKITELEFLQRRAGLMGEARPQGSDREPVHGEDYAPAWATAPVPTAQHAPRASPVAVHEPAAPAGYPYHEMAARAAAPQVAESWADTDSVASMASTSSAAHLGPAGSKPPPPNTSANGVAMAAKSRAAGDRLRALLTQPSTTIGAPLATVPVVARRSTSAIGEGDASIFAVSPAAAIGATRTGSSVAAHESTLLLRRLEREEARPKQPTVQLLHKLETDLAKLHLAQTTCGPSS